MKRHDVNHTADKSYFRRTAVSSKAINVRPITYRGGIRL